MEHAAFDPCWRPRGRRSLTYPFIGGLHHWTTDPNEYSALTTTYGWVGEGGSEFVIQ